MSLSQQTFLPVIAGKAQVSLMTLSIAQKAQHEDPPNAASNHVINDTCAFPAMTCHCLLLLHYKPEEVQIYHFKFKLNLSKKVYSKANSQQ